MYTDGGSYIDGTGWMDKLSFFMLPIKVGAAVANGAVDLYRTRVFVASAQDVTEEVIDAFEGPDPTTRFPSPAPTVTSPPTPGHSLAFTTTGSCILTSNDNCVSSGNYPSSYSNYESCTITPLGNGLLSVVSFSTEGYYDTLSIDIDGDGANDATYSGYYSAGPDGVQVSPSTSMYWYSDGSVTAAGWQICADDYTNGTAPSQVPNSASPTTTRFPTPVPSSEIIDWELYCRNMSYSPTATITPNPSPLPNFPPTPVPSSPPTRSPSNPPTLMPVPQPTEPPTTTPTLHPTLLPTVTPIPTDTRFPTATPVQAPTRVPSASPTPLPTVLPTPAPTTRRPTGLPTSAPTQLPTPTPTQLPTSLPTPAPTSLVKLKNTVKGGVLGTAGGSVDKPGFYEVDFVVLNVDVRQGATVNHYYNFSLNLATGLRESQVTANITVQDPEGLTKPSSGGLESSSYLGPSDFMCARRRARALLPCSPRAPVAVRERSSVLSLVSAILPYTAQVRVRGHRNGIGERYSTDCGQV